MSTRLPTSNVSETVVERLENCRKRYDVQRRCVMDDSDWHLALDVRLLQGRKFKAQTLIVTDRVMAITGAGDAQAGSGEAERRTGEGVQGVTASWETLAGACGLNPST